PHLARWVLPPMFIYVLMCDLNTPAMRAYLYLGFSVISRERRWSWTTMDVVLISGLLCAMLRPGPALGLSLYLSWVTSFILAVLADGFYRQLMIFMAVQVALAAFTTL